MKKGYVIQSVTLAVTFIALFSFQSCSKLLGSYNITLNTGTVTFIIPPTPVGSTSVIGTAVNTYNVDSFIKATTVNTLSTSNITSVKLSSIVLNITSGNNPTNSFSNFSAITTSFSSNTNSNPYQLTQLIIPSGSTTLAMPVDSTTELKTYLNGNTFNYSLQGTVIQATTDTMTCTVQFSFKMSIQG